ncbi:hypothetical protein FA13DRAFT_1767107 [Coprinellus micaceus]|uniref:Uncharacterized protein n=1 Tax=Coprinellus micaceus TaxID=71717 RepID=A0A4Y7SD33_COPMI|nr:hypothetical protein FA13DRAFT_1767107 [Coprinellus micaceus]
MRPTNDSQHDEINLFRLVRRLDKAIQVKDGWEAEGEGGHDEIRIKARKELQKVKYARKLVRNVEGYEQGSSEHIRRVNAVKISLDKIEGFLKDTEARHTFPLPRPTRTLLSQLPPPRDKSLTPLSDGFASPPQSTGDLSTAEKELEDGQTTPKSTLPASLSLSENDNFLLSPPEEIPGLPSSGLVSAIPALLSAEPLDVPPPYRAAFPTPLISTFPSRTTALPSASTSLTNRATSSTEAHTSLHGTRLHFADALEKDKAVVEAALGKVEGNLGFMEGQRKRLRDFAGKSGGTTWLTLGIVLAVLLLFVVMVGFIRLTRI